MFVKYSMCGIVAICSDMADASGHLMNGMKLLINRGYDSVGIAMTSPSRGLVLEKYASGVEATNDCVAKLEERADIFHGLRTGIAHTRWATHGKKCKVNAHPHLDQDGSLALVHNGIIKNADGLRDMLTARGYTFRSETDSEVIVNLLSMLMKRKKDIICSIQEAMTMLEGTYAVAVLVSGDDSELYVFKRGSPLLVGHRDGVSMAVSEAHAFTVDNVRYTEMPDMSLAVLTRDGIRFVGENSPVTWSVSKALGASVSRFHFESWYEKEMNEQPLAIERLIKNGKDLFTGLEKDLQHIVMVGCGSSYHAGLYTASFMRDIPGIQTVQVYDAGEFEINVLPPEGKTLLLLLSQSGETRDVVHCLEIVKGRRRVFTAAVVNVVDSLIGRLADYVIPVHAGREISVASTKSFTSMVVVLYMLSCWMSNKSCDDVRSLPDHIREVLDMPITHKIERNLRSAFILGRGSTGEAIAREASLKLKEIGYLHAEGMSTSSLKHGPLALIDDDCLVIAVGSDIRSQNTIHELKARDARVTVIANSAASDVVLPDADHFTPLLANVYLQRLALDVARQKKIHPDFPRHLAKVVTVD